MLSYTFKFYTVGKHFGFNSKPTVIGKRPPNNFEYEAMGPSIYYNSDNPGVFTWFYNTLEPLKKDKTLFV